MSLGKGAKKNKIEFLYFQKRDLVVVEICMVLKFLERLQPCLFIKKKIRKNCTKENLKICNLNLMLKQIYFLV